MRLLAQCDLDGRGNGGEGIGLVDRGGRRFLFIAHESAPRNFTIVDVSDPRRPDVVRTVDLPHQEVRSNSLSISASGELMAVAYQVRRPGLQPAGVELFDITTPASPRSVGFFDTSGPFSRGTHFVWVVGDRVYVATGLPDFEPVNPLDDQIVVVLDVADPARPREAGRWWLPGTRRGDAEPVSAVGHACERDGALRIGAKAAIGAAREAFQFSRSLHSSAGGVLHLQADFSRRRLRLDGLLA